MNKLSVTRKNKRRVNFKLYLIAGIFLFIIFLLIARIGFIKIKHGAEYEKKAIVQQFSNGLDIITNANRGSILDRNLKNIASSNTVYNLILDIRILADQKEDKINKTFSELVKAFNLDQKELENYLSRDKDGKLINDTHYLIAKRDISHKQMSDIDKKKLVGVYFESGTKRFYVHNNLAAQVIGFIRGDESCGLEKKYNNYLTGLSGRITRKYDTQGNIFSYNIDAQDGYSIVTTLDINIQKFAQEEVEKIGEENEAQHAQIIVMDPNTGEIIAMAQYPDFDLNNPMNLDGLSSQKIKSKLINLNQEDIINNLYGVWNNFGVSGTFEPGSIFKPIVVAAALEQNIINPNSCFYCSGVTKVADTKIRCWKRNGHGTQNIEYVLANSCNSGMIQIVQKLGRDKFYKYQKDLGYGEKTGIDLPAEQSAKNLIYDLNKLNPVELATCSMGQGFNNTPIQALNSFAAIINGGNLMQPYLVSKIIDSDSNVIQKNEPKLIRKVISQETSDFMRNALKTVLTEGTAKSGIIEGYNIGGKTGTGEQGKRGSGIHTYSFIGYLTVEDPRYIAIAIVDRPPREKVPSAAPSIKNIFEKIIKYKQMRSDTDFHELVGEKILLDDFKGKRLKEVIKILNEQNLDYEVIGSDGIYVASQMPIAGTPVEPDSKVYLYLSGEKTKEKIDLVTVPDLVNLDLEQALMVLKKINLEYVIVDKKAENSETKESENIGVAVKVIEQMPEPGIKLETGTQIRLKVE